MTRAWTKQPIWTWACDACGREATGELAREQRDLTLPAAMRRRGWTISDGCPIRDLCPDCTTKEKR